MVLNDFDVSNVYWERKITSNFSDKISSKICWKIKNIQTFNIEKQLIHNFVNGYKRFQAFQMFTGIKLASRGCVRKYRLRPLYVMVVNVF